MIWEYISVTYSYSKTWVCPHSWTRRWSQSGRPCQGWGRRWRPWRGRRHRRRRGAPRTPSSRWPPAPAPPVAPASPSLTFLLVSWQENGLRFWSSQTCTSARTHRIEFAWKQRQKGGKQDWGGRKAQLESNKDRRGEGGSLTRQKRKLGIVDRATVNIMALPYLGGLADWVHKYLFLPKSSSLVIWQSGKQCYLGLNEASCSTLPK